MEQILLDNQSLVIVGTMTVSAILGLMILVLFMQVCNQAKLLKALEYLRKMDESLNGRLVDVQTILTVLAEDAFRYNADFNEPDDFEKAFLDEIMKNADEQVKTNTKPTNVTPIRDPWKNV